MIAARHWFTRRRSRWGLVAGGGVLLMVALAFMSSSEDESVLTAEVMRGDLTATLTTTGVLRPLQSVTYRSPVAGREIEIIELVPEGSRVRAGDVVIRLETAEVFAELERARAEHAQAELDLEVAEGEWADAQAALKSITEGDGALTVEEARARLQAAERQRDRLQRDFALMAPLLERGFITRDELDRIRDDLDQAEAEWALARRRTGVVVELNYPRETRRAELQLAQRGSQRERARVRLRDATIRVDQFEQLVDQCTVVASQPGLVIYEEVLGAVPRRKVRVGDRVTASQGIVTIPDVDRLFIETSVGEASVHRVKAGQRAEIRVEAFPTARLTGRVSRVGTLASASVFRPIEDKRFDVVVELDPSTVDLRPEMTARADIVVGSRTGVLLAPVAALFEREGRTLAYVAGRSGIETRVVTAGEFNDRVVEVLSGLLEHDRVHLQEPGAHARVAR